MNSDIHNPETGHPYRPLSDNEKVMRRVHYGEASVEQEVSLEYLGEGNPPGSSEYVVQALRFDIDSSSRLAGAGGISNQTQGIYFIAPR